MKVNLMPNTSKRSSLPEVFHKKVIAKNFAGNFAALGEYPCGSAISGLRPATFLKMRLCHRCLSVTFAKFLNTFF